MEKPMQFEQRPDDGLGGGNTGKAENIEGKLSFGWGPVLGGMSWIEAEEEIVALNKQLKEGEDPWRLPTKEEWEEVLKPFTEADEKGVSDEELHKTLEDIRKTNNLQSNYYWSSTTGADFPSDALVVNMYSGNVSYNNKDIDGILARCVR